MHVKRQMICIQIDVRGEQRGHAFAVIADQRGRVAFPE